MKSERERRGGDRLNIRHTQVHRQKGERYDIFSFFFFLFFGRWTFSLARLDLKAELVLQSARGGGVEEGKRDRERERDKKEEERNEIWPMSRRISPRKRRERMGETGDQMVREACLPR